MRAVSGSLLAYLAVLTPSLAAQDAVVVDVEEVAIYKPLNVSEVVQSDKDFYSQFEWGALDWIQME
jgi:hypothetical protein